MIFMFFYFQYQLSCVHCNSVSFSSFSAPFAQARPLCFLLLDLRDLWWMIFLFSMPYVGTWSFHFVTRFMHGIKAAFWLNKRVRLVFWQEIRDPLIAACLIYLQLYAHWSPTLGYTRGPYGVQAALNNTRKTISNLTELYWANGFHTLLTDH